MIDHTQLHKTFHVLTDFKHGFTNIFHERGFWLLHLPLVSQDNCSYHRNNFSSDSQIKAFVSTFKLIVSCVSIINCLICTHLKVI